MTTLPIKKKKISNSLTRAHTKKDLYHFKSGAGLFSFKRRWQTTLSSRRRKTYPSYSNASFQIGIQRFVMAPVRIPIALILSEKHPVFAHFYHFAILVDEVFFPFELFPDGAKFQRAQVCTVSASIFKFTISFPLYAFTFLFCALKKEICSVLFYKFLLRSAVCEHKRPPPAPNPRRHIRRKAEFF